MFKLFLLFCLYLPFQLALNPAEGVDLASARVFILILFLSWLAEGFKKKRIIIKRDAQTAFVIIFLFLCFFSVFGARNGAWAVRKLLYLLSVFPLYFIVSDLINSREKLIMAMKALVFSGTLAAFWGILQFAGQFVFGLDFVYKNWAKYGTIPFLGKNFGAMVLSDTSWLVNISGRTYFRAVSVFPDPHMLSFFLGMLLPLSVALAFLLKEKKWWFAAAIIFTADMLTFSRGGYFGLVGALAVLGFVLFFQSGIRRKYKIIVLVAGVSAVAVLFVPGPVSSRFFSSFNLKEGSNKGRLAMWEKAGEIINSQPLTGVGLGNYSLFVDPLAIYRNSIYAHNTYLDIAAETGLPGALAFLGFLTAVLLSFLKKAKRDVLYWFLAASVAVFSVHSLVDTAVYSPVDLSLFLIIAGFSTLKKENEKNI